MNISLNKTVRPSKLQPMIFSLAKDFSKKKDREDYKAVVSSDNEVMCVIVTPYMFEKYQKLNRAIEEAIDEIEDEECSERLLKVLEKNKKAKFISGEDVFKEAGLS